MNPISNNPPPNLRPVSRVDALTDTKQAFLRQLEQLRASSNAGQVETKPATEAPQNIEIAALNTAAPTTPKAANSENGYRKGMVLDIKV